MKKTIFAVVLTLLFTAALASSQGYNDQGYRGYGMMGPGMMGGWGYGVWSLVWLGFWGLALVGLVLLIVWLYKKTTEKTAGQTPLEILQTRYAKGEITKKQYEEMKKGLE